MLGLRVTAGKPCERVRERALGRVADIERRIAELTTMHEALERLADKCQDQCAPGASAFLDGLAQPFAAKAS